MAGRISDLVEQLKAAEKTIAQFSASALGERVPDIVAQSETVGGITLVAVNVGSVDSNDSLRKLVIDVRDRIGSDAAVVALGAEVDGKGAVVIATNDSARTRDHKAGVYAKIAAEVLGGGGGGRDDVAQGGGPVASAVGAALDGIRAAIIGS